MRRPLLIALLVQSLVILFLYFIDPWGLGSALLPSSGLAGQIGIPALSDGVVAELTGVAVKSQPAKGYIAVTVRVAEIVLASDEEHAQIHSSGEKVLVRIKADPEELDAYDIAGREISVTGQLSIPDGRRNPGCFDYRLYLKGRRIFTVADVSRYRAEFGSVKRPVLHLLSRCKGRFYAAVKPYLSEEEFQLLAGLMFGDTSLMDDSLYEQFRLTGIAHVLAVSGLHVGLLYAVVLKLLKGRSVVVSAAVSGGLILVYAALSSFSVSVLRASFMITLNIAARFLKRRYDLTNAATLTAIVFLFFNPYQLFDSGFQLSFCAAYTMGVALPWATLKGIELSDKYKKKWILKAFEIFSPAVMVQLGMTPLILFHFTTFSPAGILINPVAVLLAGILLPAGLVLFLISMTGIAALTAFGAWPAGILAKLLILLSGAGQYALPGSYVPALPLAATTLYYAGFFWFFSETRVTLNRRRKYASCLAAGLLALGSACALPKALGASESMLPWRYDVHEVTFLDVGQGDCIHISKDGYNILIDGGGSLYSNIAERTLRPYLLKNGIDHIDLAVITHEDTDHALGIRQLQEIFDVRQTAVLGDSNEDCGVLLIDTGSLRLLLMSDADISREEELCAKYGKALRCDVLKVGHHGSPYSTGEQLLKCASPSFAVISCGRNNIYGHPADRVVELLAESGIIYARTDESGAVYLKKAENGMLIFENASKSTRWLIPETRQTPNTPQKQ
ncbi:MAG: ComEC/Rec2 family competence protein [Clostridia bacterium]|nr:ComEC/Rec2 family competence protein [Clostridia bacterium]